MRSRHRRLLAPTVRGNHRRNCSLRQLFHAYKTLPPPVRESWAATPRSSLPTATYSSCRTGACTFTCVRKRSHARIVVQTSKCIACLLFALLDLLLLRRLIRVIMGPPVDCLCSIVQLVYEPDGTIPTEPFCQSCRSMLVFIGMRLACARTTILVPIILLLLLFASLKHEFLAYLYVFYSNFEIPLLFVIPYKVLLLI